MPTMPNFRHLLVSATGRIAPIDPRALNLPTASGLPASKALLAPARRCLTFAKDFSPLRAPPPK